MIFGRNSTTVTSAPRRDQTEPSSRPMAPPPTTTSFFGTDSKAMAWSDETTVWPSNFMKGSSTGAEPVAMTKFFAETETVSFSPLTDSEVAEVNVAVPVRTATLRALARRARPPTFLATTSSLRFSIVGTSMSTEPSLMPWAAAWVLAKAKCSEEWRRALLGIQPTLRQVPPRVARLSMSATLRPSCAARKAHT